MEDLITNLLINFKNTDASKMPYCKILLQDQKRKTTFMPETALMEPHFCKEKNMSNSGIVTCKPPTASPHPRPSKQQLHIICLKYVSFPHRYAELHIFTKSLSIR